MVGIMVSQEMEKVLREFNINTHKNSFELSCDIGVVRTALKKENELYQMMLDEKWRTEKDFRKYAAEFNRTPWSNFEYMVINFFYRIILIWAVVCICGGLLMMSLDGTTGNDLESTLSRYVMFIVGIVMGLAAYKLHDIRKGKKNIAAIDNAVSVYMEQYNFYVENRNYIPDWMSINNKHIKLLTDYMNEIASSSREAIPPQYFDVAADFKYLYDSRRADNLKECITSWENIQHQARIEAEQQRQGEAIAIMQAMTEQTLIYAQEAATSARNAEIWSFCSALSNM